MQYVANLSEADVGELKMILMDKDGEAALKFLKDKISKPIEKSLHKALDVSKGHV